MTTNYRILPIKHGKRTSYVLQSRDQNQYDWTEMIPERQTLEALALIANNMFGIDISTVQTVKIWTNEECDLLKRQDIMEYFDDAIYEVTEFNGNRLTKALVVDVLMDNAKWPEGMTFEQIKRTANRIARAYVGK